MEITAHQLAKRFIGVHEVDGDEDHPLIQFAMSTTTYGSGAIDTPDSVPWCSAFVNFIAWLLDAPRSNSAMARSWLSVGRPVKLEGAVVGWDVVIFSRGDPGGTQGHVGFFSGVGFGGGIKILGGNQGDEVNVTTFPTDRILGIRRLIG